MQLFKDFNDYSRVAAQPAQYLADGSQIPLLPVSYTNKYNKLVSFKDVYVLTMFYYSHNQKNQLPIRSFIHFINYNNIIITKIV